MSLALATSQLERPPQPELAGHTALLNYEDAAKPDSSHGLREPYFVYTLIEFIHRLAATATE